MKKFYEKGEEQVLILQQKHANRENLKFLRCNIVILYDAPNEENQDYTEMITVLENSFSDQNQFAIYILCGGASQIATVQQIHQKYKIPLKFSGKYENFEQWS